MSVESLDNEQAVWLLDKRRQVHASVVSDENLESDAKKKRTPPHQDGDGCNWIRCFKIGGSVVLAALVVLLAIACVYLLNLVVMEKMLLDAIDEASDASQVYMPYHDDLLVPIDPSDSGRTTLPPEGAPCVAKSMNVYCSTGHDEKYKGECPFWQWYMTTEGWVLLPEHFTEQCPSE